VAVEQALATMRALADAESVRSIAMPRIGVGYGGLSWPRVREIAERVFADWYGTIYVYEAYRSEAVDSPESSESAYSMSNIFHPWRAPGQR
jgi:O-acetyl-ADP-ribose deacetylase (regulator of RNase III)